MIGDGSSSNASMEDSADAVEVLWARSGDAPELQAFLADHPHWLPRELRTALLVDQQYRSRTSQSWSTEDYMALVPSLAGDDDLMLDLIYGECRERSRQGNPANLTELAVRFPHLQPRLQRQLEIAAWFDDASCIDSLDLEKSVDV